MNIVSNVVATEIKELDLLNKSYNMDYQHYISSTVNNSVIVNKVSDILNNLFNKKQEDISRAVVMSFAFSRYGDEVFVPYKTIMDQKLISYSNKIIKYLTQIMDGCVVTDDFYIALNKYYSLFVMWKSREQIRDVSRIDNDIVDDIETFNVMKKLNMCNNQEDVENKLIKRYRDMTDINSVIAVGLILKHYKIYLCFDHFISIFWNNIIESPDNIYWDSILTVIAEIRKKNINDITDICLKKRVYYLIDTDELTKKIYHKTIECSHIVPVFNIFNECLTYHKIDTITIDQILTQKCSLILKKNIVQTLHEFCDKFYNY